MTIDSLVAYIDAGTGSYLLAAIASGAAGIWFFVTSKVARLKRRGKSSESEVDEGVQEATEEPSAESSATAT